MKPLTSVPSRTEQVYSAIRESICDCSLEPGTHLVLTNPVKYLSAAIDHDYSETSVAAPVPVSERAKRLRIFRTYPHRAAPSNGMQIVVCLDPHWIPQMHGMISNVTGGCRR